MIFFSPLFGAVFFSNIRGLAFPPPTSLSLITSAGFFLFLCPPQALGFLFDGISWYFPLSSLRNEKVDCVPCFSPFLVIFFLSPFPLPSIFPDCVFSCLSYVTGSPMTSSLCLYAPLPPPALPAAIWVSPCAAPPFSLPP